MDEVISRRSARSLYINFNWLKIVLIVSLPILATCIPYPFLYYTQQEGSRAGYGRNIRPLPCATEQGATGVCMFAWDCMKANGTHLGTCIDRFYFGSCCKLKPGTSKPVHKPMKTNIKIRATTTEAPIQTLPTNPDSENEIIDLTVSPAAPFEEISSDSGLVGIIPEQTLQPTSDSSQWPDVTSIPNTGEEKESFQVTTDGTEIQEQTVDDTGVSDSDGESSPQTEEQTVQEQEGVTIIFPDPEIQAEMQEESGDNVVITQQEQIEQGVQSEFDSTLGQTNIEDGHQNELVTIVETDNTVPELEILDQSTSDLGAQDGQTVTMENNNEVNEQISQQQETEEEQGTHTAQIENIGTEEESVSSAASEINNDTQSKPVTEETFATAEPQQIEEETEQYNEEVISTTENTNDEQEISNQFAGTSEQSGAVTESQSVDETVEEVIDETSVDESHSTLAEFEETTQAAVADIEPETIEIEEDILDTLTSETEQSESETTETVTEEENNENQNESSTSLVTEDKLDGENETTTQMIETTDTIEELTESPANEDVSLSPSIEENLIVPTGNETSPSDVQDEGGVTDQQEQEEVPSEGNAHVSISPEIETSVQDEQSSVLESQTQQQDQTDQSQTGDNQESSHNVGDHTETVPSETGNQMEIEQTEQLEQQPSIVEIESETTTQAGTEESTFSPDETTSDDGEETETTSDDGEETETTSDTGEETEVTTSKSASSENFIIPGVVIVSTSENQPSSVSSSESLDKAPATTAPPAIDEESEHENADGTTDAALEQESTTEIAPATNKPDIDQSEIEHTDQSEVENTDQSEVEKPDITEEQEIMTIKPTVVVKPEETATTEALEVAKPEEIETTSPAVAKPEEIETTSPAVAKPEEIETTSPAVTKPEEIETTSPAVAKPEEIETTSPSVSKPDETGEVVIGIDAQLPNKTMPEVSTETVFETQEDELLHRLNTSSFRDICGSPVYPTKRIVGGSQASFGEWPWQVSLRQWRSVTYLHKCGAALVNENWAITAAHCVENAQPDQVLLRLGEFDLERTNEPYGYVERKVQIIATHPQFDPRTFEYDLALLRFNEPVNFQPNIIPICIPETDYDFIGDTGFVSGWGRLYEDGPLPSVMQKVPVPVITNSECEVMYKNAGYVEDIPNIFICAGYEAGKRDSCEGDSGGPLVIRYKDTWQLAGVISWGIGCALPNQPGVYTRISAFREWINKIIVF